MPVNTRETIDQYFGLLSGELEGNFIDCLDESIVWHLPPHHPFGADFDGKDQVLKMLERGLPMFRLETMKVELHLVVADGEHAFAHFTMRAVTSKGKDYENQYFFRFRVQGGKIVEIWEAMDSLYMASLGMYD